MGTDYRLTQMYMPFYAACISTLIGFIFFIFAFAGPYWLESFHLVHSSFLHMGIWSACFDHFVHPRDYHANVLSGCYWIFNRFFFQIGIWEWLNPYWLVAVQVLVVLGFIAKLCVIVILILYYLLYGHPAAESTMAFAGEVFVGVTLSVSILIFGFKSQDRAWMPRPDQMFLSWSFGFAILAAIASYVSAGFLFCVSYTDREVQEDVQFFEDTEQPYGGRSMLSVGRGGTMSITGQSNYGRASNVGGVMVKVPSLGGRPEHVVTLDPDLRHMGALSESMSLLASDSRPQDYRYFKEDSAFSKSQKSYHDPVQQPSLLGSESFLSSGSNEPRIAGDYGISPDDPLYVNQRTPSDGHSMSPVDEYVRKPGGGQLSYSPIEEELSEDSQNYSYRVQAMQRETQSGYRSRRYAPRH